MKIEFFQKTKVSNKVNAGGPSPMEQLSALANDTYWTVLNTSFLRFSSNDTVLSDRANAFKHALQTYGLSSTQLPDTLRPNKNKAKGSIYHGHVNDSNGTTYVLEWSVIDVKNRVIALTNFAKHENFPFKKNPLSKAEIEAINADPKNIKIMKLMKLKAEEAAEKVDRIENNTCKI